MSFRLEQRLEDCALTAGSVQGYLQHHSPDLASKISLKIDELEVLLSEAEDDKAEHESEDEDDSDDIDE